MRKSYLSPNSHTPSPNGISNPAIAPTHVEPQCDALPRLKLLHVVNTQYSQRNNDQTDLSAVTDHSLPPHPNDTLEALSQGNS